MRVITFVIALCGILNTATELTAQEIAHTRAVGRLGLNVFEAPKEDVPFEGLAVRLGGDFALQFQGLTQESAVDSTFANRLANNFNLPSANQNVDVQLDKGLRVHLRTYLSSRHHTEAYVKGGYLQIDDLEFVSEGLLSDVMQVVRVRVGMDDINYGDAHFRRSDNAQAMYNPFVGNYIMDSFTTEPFLEVSYLGAGGILAVIGATNGRLNQKPTDGDNGLVIYGKVGYDKQTNDALRVRLTGSLYRSNAGGTRDYLYGGDRAGGRYYAVLSGGDFDGRFNPRYAHQTAVMINPFIKYNGIEFFGLLESVSNGADAGGGYTHIGSELLYRLGAEEDIYVGARYNQVSGEQVDGAATRTIDRLNIGAGWFMTDNVLSKLEYVAQTYSEEGFTGTLLEGADFSGFMLEAVIGF
jgi:hypothetical protein